MNPLIKQVEQEAIIIWGADKIGTHELRVALPKEEKRKLLGWLIQQYSDRGGVWGSGYGGFRVVF